MTTDKQAEMTFKDPCCATCAAWKQTQGLNGECHLMPPQALFAGFQQPPQVQGLQLNGRLPPQPIILGAFPAVNAQNICRQWQPDMSAEKAPECPVPGGTYLPSIEDRAADLDFMDRAARDLRTQDERAAEGAKHQGELQAVAPACEHKNVEFRFDLDCKVCKDCNTEF